jgi:hypothetical protein
MDWFKLNCIFQFSLTVELRMERWGYRRVNLKGMSKCLIFESLGFQSRRWVGGVKPGEIVVNGLALHSHAHAFNKTMSGLP